MKKVIGEEYIVPLIDNAIWEDAKEINYDILPDRFVLKCNHDSGSAIVCRDKSLLDRQFVFKKLSAALKENCYEYAREWPYKDIPHKIFAEKYLCDSPDSKIIDYKFYCFNGEPKFLYISQGLEDHATANITFYDLNGKRMPFQRRDYKLFDEDIELPANFGEMILLARKIALYVGNSFLRVDLYNINGKIYFSEVTFTPVGGYMKVSPPEWDRKLGDMLVLQTADKQ